MASPSDPSIPSSTRTLLADDATVDRLDVAGTLPAAMSGRLLGVHDDVVHSVHVHAGRVSSYRSRRVRSDARRRSAATDLFLFSGTILAFGAGSLAHELSLQLATLRPVDLAGRFRPLAVCPKRDPRSGDLHLLTSASDGAQGHVVVSAGGLTRRSRVLTCAPSVVRDLAIAADHIVFLSDGFIGIASRDVESPVVWIPTGGDASALAHADDTDETVVVTVATVASSLERWTFHVAAAAVRREVLDPGPLRFARATGHQPDGAPGMIWTVGERTVCTYGLTTGHSGAHHFGRRRPGDLVFVDDPGRPNDAGGWLVGFVHDAARDGADLVVLDAGDISRPAVATVHVPRRIPPGLRATWVPDTDQSPPPNQGDRP